MQPGDRVPRMTSRTHSEGWNTTHCRKDWKIAYEVQKIPQKMRKATGKVNPNRRKRKLSSRGADLTNNDERRPPETQERTKTDDHDVRERGATTTPQRDRSV